MLASPQLGVMPSSKQSMLDTGDYPQIISFQQTAEQTSQPAVQSVVAHTGPEIVE